MLARRWSVAVLLVVDRDLFVRTVADISDAVQNHQNQKAMQEQCGCKKKENREVSDTIWICLKKSFTENTLQEE
tara:strand:- start:1096 stop:1317 length:222 start_codon:yes stop_codon:yes gene_type:complete